MHSQIVVPYKALPPEWRPQVTFPLILGTDISGVVEAVAEDVQGSSVGGEVSRWFAFPAVSPVTPAARNNRLPSGLHNPRLRNAHRGNTMAKKTYHGSCHCGAVAFEAKIDLDKGTTRCNCSICTKTRFWFALVQADDFKIEKGGDQLSDYTWIPPGKSEANLHYRFCETCGVRVFAQGDKASAGGRFYAVAIAALDDIEQDADQVAKSIKYVDGRHDDYGHKPADTRLL
jgi:hypothetical protein